MKILLLTQWYPPEPVKLISELAESLQSLGHQLEVLTGFPNYPHGRLYPHYEIKAVQREEIDGIRVIRVPLYPDHSRVALKRILNYLSFSFSAALIGTFATQKPDVILVYGSPYTAAIPAIVQKWLRGVPFVFYVVDLWPESLQGTGMVSGRTAISMVRFFARQIYRRAARIIAVSPGFFRQILKEGIPDAKVALLSTWVDVEYYSPRPPDAAVRERLHLNGKFTVLFAGNIGPAQGIDTVIDAAFLLRSSPEIEVLIAGDGILLPAARERAAKLGATNIRFLGGLPSSDMPGLFASADVLLVHLASDPLWEITIPHKIFAYMASSKPVLAAVSGDAADIISNAKAGLTCTPGDADALASSIRRMAVMPAGDLSAMGTNGRRLAVSEFSRSQIIGKLERVLQSAVAPHG